MEATAGAGSDGDLLEPATAERLAQARAGADMTRRLRVATLAAGDVGVLEVQVRAVAPTRRYARQRGGDGIVGRVTLADATGEVDLVLWDDETRLCADGPLQPGAFVRVRGPSVKAAYRGGGVELGLGRAVVEPIATQAHSSAGGLAGTLVELGDVRAVGAPPATRFTCDAVLRLVDGGTATVCLWDGAVKAARAAGLGAAIRLPTALRNPLLDGWWTADGLETA